MKKVIAVASTSFSHNLILIEELKKKFSSYSLKLCPEPTELKNETLQSFLSQSSCAIIGKEKIDYQLLKNSPNLKFLSKYGVGTDNIDFEACKYLELINNSFILI